jgi:hypothetical protein
MPKPRNFFSALLTSSRDADALKLLKSLQQATLPIEPLLQEGRFLNSEPDYKPQKTQGRISHEMSCVLIVGSLVC